MIGRYFDGIVPYPGASGSGAQSHSFAVDVPRAIASFGTSFDALDFSRALETAWALVAAVDGYLTANAPWKQLEGTTDEQQQALRADILYTAAEAIRIITALVYPVIPDAAAKVWAQLGLGDIRTADLKNLQWRGLQPGTKLGELSPLFPRADKETIIRMSELEQKNTPPPAAAEPTAAEASAPSASPTASAEPHISKLHSLVDGLAVAIAESTTETAAVVGIENAIAETVRETLSSRKDATPPAASAPATAAAPGPGRAPTVPEGKISIDDFAKVELRVAQVKVAERVPKADKLLRLEVDLGYETRQILAGIAESYTPESLIGRKVVIVANLAPRMLRGYESNGMIVAASVEGGKAVLASFLEDIEIGARLK
jgi:methionyl-tRNA synthetase